MSFQFMPVYTGDYIRDTRHLSPLKHGIYFLALMHCWDQKGPLPLDEQECAGICNCRSTDEIDALRYILERFFVRMADGHYNRRMQHELERAEAISGARSEAGKKGYQAKAKQLLSKRLASASTPTPTPTPTPTRKDAQPSAESEPADADSAVAVIERARTGKKIPHCPHEDIVEIYHSTLPELPHVVALNDKRKRLLTARWRQVVVEDELDVEGGIGFFVRYFRKVAQSKFLTGRTKATGDRAPFRADFEWLICPSNFMKVVEGRYE